MATDDNINIDHVAPGESGLSAPHSSSADPPIMQSKHLFYDENAERISIMIDEELKEERIRRKEAKRKQVKVILLGQAESGKSTLQKQFQIYYASQTLDHERPSWRPVVHFNIIKAVRMILNELDYELAPRPASPSSSLSASTGAVASSGESGTADPKPDGAEVYAEMSHLRQKLCPLVAIEDALASELSGGISLTGGRRGVYVRSGWQALISSSSSLSSSAWSKSGFGSSPSSTAMLAAKTLLSTKGDIEELWRHPAVKAMLRLRKLRLDESASFFLDNIHRVAEPDYSPSTDDILHVRLQTLGVVEHSFDIGLGGSSYNWIMYDVGGARGQRPAWVPYFDDATAVIFLAPISAFDQYLDEDPRTNRIDDSLQLFSMICSNKLLQKSHLVLLLNKVDILKKKLKAGVKVRKYITSYGNRANTYEEVSEYFRGHFLQVHRKKDVSSRTLYVHFTSMLDIEATQSIINTVGEAVIRSHIAQIGLV